MLHPVADTSEVPPGRAIAVDVAGRRVALFNVDGTYYALDDACPHSGGPLSEGDVERDPGEGDRIVCPWHSAAFRLRDGAVLCPPAEEGVTSYAVAVAGTTIQVEVP
jgi:nitrite reductase/ring-hydroxylating ferredoxin subunit